MRYTRKIKITQIKNQIHRTMTGKWKEDNTNRRSLGSSTRFKLFANMVGFNLV